MQSASKNHYHKLFNIYGKRNLIIYMYVSLTINYRSEREREGGREREKEKMSRKKFYANI